MAVWLEYYADYHFVTISHNIPPPVHREIVKVLKIWTPITLHGYFSPAIYHGKYKCTHNIDFLY